MDVSRNFITNVVKYNINGAEDVKVLLCYFGVEKSGVITGPVIMHYIWSNMSAAGPQNLTETFEIISCTAVLRISSRCGSSISEIFFLEDDHPCEYYF